MANILFIDARISPSYNHLLATDQIFASETLAVVECRHQHEHTLMAAVDAVAGSFWDEVSDTQQIPPSCKPCGCDFWSAWKK